MWQVSDCPEAIQLLIVQGWHQDPRSRPSFSQILQQIEQYRSSLDPAPTGQTENDLPAASRSSSRPKAALKDLVFFNKSFSTKPTRATTLRDRWCTAAAATGEDIGSKASPLLRPRSSSFQVSSVDPLGSALRLHARKEYVVWATKRILRLPSAGI